ncbi:MAG: TRAP transporter large permease [Candidimonas sp.]|uniref:TRAP transporter large permease protein n=2 Tax=Pollutimonas thiosulfatoxidans TaxID=2028345 RepID=A0A451FSZ1_9BURK|nr:TRAP transporter large permease [Candidimonas sp.]NYT45470.1 TRAP transporter large permease [Alcaligenaceae bacterium]QAA95679.1 ABC transporter permease [Pollutimonas thiosulfatoxidans]
MSLSILVLFLVIMLMGVPIAVAMGVSAGMVIWWHDLPLSVLAQRMTNALDSTPLLAVPMFIFAASLFNASGITGHLFDLVRLMVGRIRGGLGQVSVLTSLIFSGMSGAALADIGALGGTQMRLMREQGYRDEFAAGITMASATIGPIFPPSIPLIIFASAAEISAVKLLVAGVIPGLLITIMLMVQIAIMARLQNLPRDTIETSRRLIARKAFVAAPALCAPLILIAGLVSGLFGPTEVAGITVLYALFLGSVVYRQLTVRAVIDAARETVHSTASVLFIVGAAALFAWVLTIDQVPMIATDLLLALSANPIVLLLIVNGLLLVVGMFMESIAAILILAPILTPALLAAGVDPIQLGVVVVLNLMIGLLTPPVGMSLYMVSIVGKMPLHRVIAGAVPFLVPLMLALLLITLVPAVSLWLPGVFLG